MQARDEFLGRCEVASFEPAASERAEPEFDLIEPRAVFGREMKDVLVVRVGQEGASFAAGAQVAFDGKARPLSRAMSSQTSRLQCVFRLSRTQWKRLLVGELRRDMGQMGRKIHAGARDAQVPDDLARGNDERSDQGNGCRGGCIRVRVFRVCRVGPGSWDIFAGGFACRSFRRSR